MSPLFKLLLVLVVPLLLIGCGVFIGGLPPEDVELQGLSLSHYVGSRVDFDRKSVINPGQPPVYCEPSRNSAQLVVWGITNADHQEEVLSAVREWQATNQNMSKLTVFFYEKMYRRQFTNDQGGYSGEERFPEVLLRKVSIVLSNKQPNTALEPTATAH